jgi:hydrogenase nickel incorporation protein HypB
MCSVCGCSDHPSLVKAAAAAPQEKGHPHSHDHGHGHHHDHPHQHAHDHTHVHGDGHTHGHDQDPTHGHGGHGHHWGTGPAGVSVPGLSQARLIEIEQNILSKNDAYADANRRRLAGRGVVSFNLLSSPGSGKTTLLVRTIELLRPRHAITVIEGDQQTSADADRIRATGVPAVQINTGKGCHLDGHMVGHALDDLRPAPGSILFIENVGNLVCPAAFDLGEAHRVVVLSVTEGEDKPLKYPDIFASADLVLINKADLLPHVDFDVRKARDFARRVQPRVTIIEVSARTGEGMGAFVAWIEAARAMMLAGQAGHDDATAATF